MKIRIKGNSIRYRLTKSEVESLCKSGFISETTQFNTSEFLYSVRSGVLKNLDIDFNQHEIELLIDEDLIKNWHQNSRVGFYHTLKTDQGNIIDIILEKDFKCLDVRDEDESDNFPNPKAIELDES